MKTINVGYGLTISLVPLIKTVISNPKSRPVLLPYLSRVFKIMIAYQSCSALKTEM